MEQAKIFAIRLCIRPLKEEKADPGSHWIPMNVSKYFSERTNFQFLLSGSHRCRLSTDAVKQFYFSMISVIVFSHYYRLHKTHYRYECIQQGKNGSWWVLESIGIFSIYEDPYDSSLSLFRYWLQIVVKLTDLW
jgi:hypothetical protein